MCFLKILLQGLAAVSIGCELAEYHPECAGGKWGFIDKTGKEVIPLIYDGLGIDHFGFSDGKVLMMLDRRPLYIDKNGNKVEE